MADYLDNIFRNCKKATLLSLKKEAQPLRFGERMQLRAHLLFCDACKQFIKQSELINKAMSGLHKQMMLPPEQGLSAAARKRMQDRLNELL